VYKNIFKRLLDFILALFGIIILCPLFLVVALMLGLSNRGKIFFLQPRPGKNGRIFLLIKFKTMSDARNKYGELLPDKQRLTSLGAFVRNFSLDELPNLINVVKGDMSLVGPRPLLVKYLGLYNEQQARRHEVLPGMTGWAQVNGRNSLSWNEKFELDVFYVENMSFKLDFKILYKTVLKVIKREAVNQNDTTTMQSFTGD